MMYNPKVSIIIPVYNGSNYIKESIIPMSKKELVDILSDISQVTIERQLNNLLKIIKIIKIEQGRSTQYKT